MPPKRKTKSAATKEAESKRRNTGSQQQQQQQHEETIEDIEENYQITINSTDEALSHINDIISLDLLVSTSEGNYFLGNDSHSIKKIIEKVEQFAGKGLQININEAIKGIVDRIISVKGTVKQISITIAKVSQYLKVINGNSRPTYSITILIPSVLLTSDSSELPDWLNKIQSTTESAISISLSQLPLSPYKTLRLDSNTIDSIASSVRLISNYILDKKEILNYFPTVAYTPFPITGVYGHPNTFQRQPINQELVDKNPLLTALKLTDAISTNGSGSGSGNVLQR